MLIVRYIKSHLGELSSVLIARYVSDYSIPEKPEKQHLLSFGSLFVCTHQTGAEAFIRC